MEKRNDKSIWLNELTWQEVDQYLKKDDILIIPVGSNEQHGAGAPLGLDTYAAIALAEDAAKNSGVLSAPPLWFGDSSHHSKFPGTISIRPETLIELTKDILRSVLKNGFRKIVIINGHKSANLPGLISAAKHVHEYDHPKSFISVIDPMKIARGIAGKTKDEPEHHAGELEISHLMYKYPHLIKKERLLDKNIDAEKIFSKYFAFDLFGGGKDAIDIVWSSNEQRKFAPTGAFSASAKASSEKGKIYHDYMVKNITEFIDWLRKYEGPIGNQE